MKKYLPFKNLKFGSRSEEPAVPISLRRSESHFVMINQVTTTCTVNWVEEGKIEREEQREVVGRREGERQEIKSKSSTNNKEESSVVICACGRIQNRPGASHEIHTNFVDDRLKEGDLGSS